MNRQIRQISFLLSLCFLLSFKSFAQLEESKNKLYLIEDSLFKYKAVFDGAISQKDTSHAISALLKLGDFYSHTAQYALAYEQLWNALSLATNSNDSLMLADIYNQIGWLYSFYRRNDEALSYYQKSIDVCKKLNDGTTNSLKRIISGYYSLTCFYRETAKFDLAREYLDSCFTVHYKLEQPANDSYLKAELAFDYIRVKDYNKAIQLLNEIEQWFVREHPSYLVILYKFWGEACKGINQFKASEQYYRKALAIGKQFSSHQNYVPIVYKCLADLYYSIGKFEQAYNNLASAREHEYFLFDSRSANNRPLLEISDNFKKEQQLNQEIIQEQRLSQLEQEKQVAFYRNIFLSSLLLLLIIFGIISYRSLRQRHKAEKQLSQQTQELERQKNREMLEHKNKELTLSALQLIEKEKYLVELKALLYNKDKSPEMKDVKQLVKSFSANRKKSWKDFETRFIDVNSTFYKNLTNRYPDLTTGELKLCALIKLNFSGKETANLMGVSLESVHTLRYRLRKKLGISHSGNMTQFLNTFD